MSKGFFTRKIFKVIVIVAVFGLLVFLNPLSFFSPIRMFLFEVTYPFQKFFSFFAYKVSDQKDFIGSIGNMKEENKKLFEENQKLSAKIAELQDLSKENENLRNQLNLLPKNKFELESASIIGQDPKGIGSWVLIDKGANRGIQTGMPVIISEGILVGRVGEVYGSSSQVILVTNPTSTVNIATVNGQARGVVRGKFGLGLLLDMVLQTDTLNAGEEVVTSGIGENMPRGLLIGHLQDIKISQDGLYQQANVIPKFHLTNLSVLSVIKQTKQN